MPPTKEPRRRRQGQGQGQAHPTPPLVWTNAGSLFFIASDVDVIKDLTAHREGRDNSLAATESFTKTQAKIDSSQGPGDLVSSTSPRSSSWCIKANAKGNEAQAQQTEVLVQELGVNGLKSVGGSLHPGSRETTTA